jgi:tRNA(Ile)-lysidine synthase
LSVLEPLGLTADDLAHTAWRLSLASDALRRHAAEIAGRIAQVTQAGDVSFDFNAFVQLPYETHLRLAAEAIRWISGEPYRPRLLSLQESLALSFSRPRTLSGALLRRRGRISAGARLVIGREPRAASRAAAVPTTARWDGRWRLSGPHAPDLEVRMLGEGGLALCPDWRDTGLERSSLIASPAVWRGDAVIAAPVAGRSEGWTAEVVPGFHEFLASGR